MILNFEKGIFYNIYGEIVDVDFQSPIAIFIPDLRHKINDIIEFLPPYVMYKNAIQVLNDGAFIMDYESRFARNYCFEEAKDFEQFTDNTATAQGYKIFFETLPPKYAGFNSQYGYMRKIFPENIELYSATQKALKFGTALFYARIGHYETGYYYDRKRAYTTEASRLLPCGEPCSGTNLKHEYIIYKVYIKKAFAKWLDVMKISGGGIHTFLSGEQLSILEEFYTGEWQAFPAFYLQQRPHLKLFIERCSGLPHGLGKYIANCFIGGFNRHRERQYMTMTGEVITEEQSLPYSPVYLAIVNRNKLFMLRTMEKIGFENILYINTDGFISKVPIFTPETPINGQLTLRKVYKNFTIKSINNIEEN